jgi:small subunit ribosomal protein S4
LVSSRAEARQLVTHRHFLVNGRMVNVPSFALKPGMLVEVRERSRTMDVFARGGTVRRPPSWLSVDPEAKRIQVLSTPSREEMDLPDLHEQLIVEFYSR